MNLPDIISRNLRLLVTFAIYVLGICVFGVIYYGLYRRKPSCFSFVADISETQRLTLMEAAKNELGISQVKADILTRLMEILQNGTVVLEDAWNKTEIRLEDGSRVALGTITLGPGDVRVPRVTLFDSQGSNLGAWYEKSDQSGFNIEGLRRLASRHLAGEENAIERCRDRLESLNEHLPRIWSFRDFLYFSIVTQTTLGYGDILPNSSTVRRIVAIQVLLGLALLVVIINIVVVA